MNRKQFEKQYPEFSTLIEEFFRSQQEEKGMQYTPTEVNICFANGHVEKFVVGVGGVDFIQLEDSATIVIFMEDKTIKHYSGIPYYATLVEAEEK